MRKVIFECVGNSILFILTGMMLIHPFSEYRNSPDEFYVVTAILPVIFAVYLIVFVTIRFFIFKNGIKSLYKDSELTYSDEREKIIVAESTKAAYMVLIFSLIVSMALLACVKAFSVTILKDMEISIYAVGIAIITLNLVLAMVSYCIKWCIEYKK